MLATCAYRGARRAWCSAPASLLSSSLPDAARRRDVDDGRGGAGHGCRAPAYSTFPGASIGGAPAIAWTGFAAPVPAVALPTSALIPYQTRAIFSSSSFSALPPDDEEKEKARVAELTPYAKEMELRKIDADLARLNTLRGINTGELYTMRGKFKMLSRDYGMGFLAWYWTVWFGTAGLSYLAIELGGVDPLVVAAKAETFLGWEPTSISGRLDPTLGQIGLVVAVNECLEPLRLPFVVVTTKPIVNFFSRKV